MVSMPPASLDAGLGDEMPMLCVNSTTFLRSWSEMC
jgi:hypothetical protein